MRFTTVNVIADMIEGRASGKSTLLMICHVLDPMTMAASRSSGATSLRLVSMSRATKGAAATVKGTMEAVVPKLVPTTHRVKGINATIKIAKGKDLPMFTIVSKILYRVALSLMCPLSVMVNI